MTDSQRSVTAPTIRVLLTEDVVADAELEVRELKRAGLRVAHRIVDSEQEFDRALREFSPDIILSDFSMPGFDGMAALAIAREQSPDTPFIFVSGTIGEEYAIRALKNGATDYVLKTNLVRLPSAVERALAEARERREKRRAETELERARELLTSIFSSLSDVLWSVDAASDQLLYVSPAAKAVFGHAADDFLVKRELWLEVAHPEDRPRLLAAWNRVRKGEPFDIDYRIVRPDGTVRWINDRGRKVLAAQHTVERIDGLARDITEQVEHRQRIARLQRIRDLSSSINSALVRLRERPALFEEICRVAVDVGHFIGAHVGLLDSQTHDVRWVAQHGASAARIRMPVSARADIESGQGLTGRALRSGKPAIWNDVEHEDGVRNRQHFLEHGVRAVASLPLVVEGRPVATFSLHAAEAGFFDQDELAMLQELAANVSFALELIEKQDRISYLALYDTLTGLPNRTLFQERLVRSIDEVDARGARVALVLMDLERFKAINDTLGEHIGDEVLRAVAGRIRDWAGGPEHVARLGGNLFALVLDEFQGEEDITRRLEAASAALFSKAFEIEGREVRLAAKSAVAVYPDHGRAADALFGNAEAALKSAKETRERILFYTPSINARVAEQVELENRLRKAVENGELFLHFQPKVDLATREIVGLEALMRLHGPDGGLISPARFVPVLEQTGLILAAGKQVIRAARAAHRDWKARGLQAPRIAVNVSALQLLRRDFVAEVRDALGSIEADGGGVDVEVTESLLMTAVDESIRKLRELREMGLRIALDDFGTGYSSLAYLTRLPLDALKIDRSFVHGMTENADHTSIISAIIPLAQALRLKVVAEGIETEQQAQLLRLLRCEQAQGYLFSPPLPAERIEALLKPL